MRHDLGCIQVDAAMGNASALDEFRPLRPQSKIPIGVLRSGPMMSGYRNHKDTAFQHVAYLGQARVIDERLAPDKSPTRQRADLHRLYSTRGRMALPRVRRPRKPDMLAERATPLQSFGVRAEARRERSEARSRRPPRRALFADAGPDLDRRDEVHRLRSRRDSASGREQPADVMAVRDLQRPDDLKPDRGRRDRRWRADRAAALVGDGGSARQHDGDRDVRDHADLPGLDPRLGAEPRCFPALSVAPGQFILKDAVLLGAAVWSLGEALRHIDVRAVVPFGSRLARRASPGRCRIRSRTGGETEI